MIRRAILIAGPTASGKSALAIEKALACGGFIVNADSMQVYDVLDVLTARPPREDLQKVEHHLYGHVPPAEHFSVARWVSDVTELLQRDDLRGRTPVFVGGTGLYFKALMGGLSSIPDVPDVIRQKWRARLEEEGPEKLHALLTVEDDLAAQRIKPQDGQRIVRALEVKDASGQPISHWQRLGSEPMIDIQSSTYLCLLPERSVLDQRIPVRLQKMVETGALDEVAALLALNLNPALPAMKAIGVPELRDYLQGKTSLDVALQLANYSTRQYVKRQTTWIRHQLGSQWQIC